MPKKLGIKSQNIAKGQLTGVHVEAPVGIAPFLEPMRERDLLIPTGDIVCSSKLWKSTSGHTLDIPMRRYFGD